jgi:hypothetical protein
MLLRMLQILQQGLPGGALVYCQVGTAQEGLQEDAAGSWQQLAIASSTWKEATQRLSLPDMSRRHSVLAGRAVGV